MNKILIVHDAWDEELLIFSLKQILTKMCDEGKLNQFRVTKVD